MCVWWERVKDGTVFVGDSFPETCIETPNGVYKTDIFRKDVYAEFLDGAWMTDADFVRLGFSLQAEPEVQMWFIHEDNER